MAERRSIWPLLVCGGLAAIAALSRKETEPTPENDRDDGVGKLYRTIYPAPDETRRIGGGSRPATQVDPDKRPREQFENDQPISAQLAPSEGGGQGTTRGGAVAHSLGGVEGHLLACLCEHQ